MATNEYLGAVLSCVNIAKDLNSHLKQYRSNKSINSTVFSLATNSIEVRLYIPWKYDKAYYYTITIRTPILQDPQHYAEFYNTIRNIID